MKESVAKTNAMRALDKERVTYTPFTYDTGLLSAVEVAHALDVGPNQVYKTLVMLRDENAPVLVMIRGDHEVQLRTLARAIGCKSVRMAPKRDAERLTGLQTGGIGALALLSKPFPVYIDAAALTEHEVFVNGGRRGLNLKLSVADLMRLTGARAVDVG